MYLQHFGLTRYPFRSLVHADELFEGQAMLETRARLRHLVDLRGIGLVTGEAGSGKTVACRRFVAELPAGLHRVAYVNLTTASVRDTCNAIARELGLAEQGTRAAAWHAIRDEISRLAGEARQLPVLIIDEAHHLRNEVIEDLRLLTNFAMDSEERLVLLFVGLSEMRRRLAMAVHESLAQRLVIRHHITGLDRDEFDAYIRHHLARAGAADIPLFEPSAIESLFLAAHGLPRKANQVAHMAMVAAAGAGERQVTAESVARAIEAVNRN